MSSLESLIIQWNNDWHYDYLWRKKYNVSFNSPQHRNASPLDIRIDLLEEKMVKSQIKKEEKRQEDFDEYKKTGEWWKSPDEIGDEKSLSISEDLFDNLNLSDF